MSEVIPKVNTNHGKTQSQTLQKVSQLTFTCWKPTTETLEKGVKYNQSQQ